MTAHPMGHYGFAAVRAGAGIYRPQGIVRTALVFLGVRGAAFGCLHEGYFLKLELNVTCDRP
jgi:hypothetical protein